MKSRAKAAMATLALGVWTLGALAMSAPVAQATELTYAPINPSFLGGNPNNGAWLLSQAQAQDNNKDPASIESASGDSLSDFKDSLNRRILSNLAQKIIENAFGEDAMKEGTYTMGDYKIQIDNSKGLYVHIEDTTTGKTTTVNIPQY